MKLSEYILELQMIAMEYGDLEVTRSVFPKPEENEGPVVLSASEVQDNTDPEFVFTRKLPVRVLL